MGLKLERQLFENIRRPTFGVGNFKTIGCLMFLSFLVHLVVLVILVEFFYIAIDKPLHVSESTRVFFVPTGFGNIKPPPPPLPSKLKLKTKTPDKRTEKLSEQVLPTVPVEAPHEIKPESPKEPKNLADDKEGAVVSGDDSGQKGGVVGGVPGGIPDGVVDQSLYPFGFSWPSQGPVEIKGDTKPPKRLKYVHPTYPPDAIRARIEGRVIIEAIIGKNGKIKNVRVIKSVLFLDLAALEAVQKWEYEPMVIDGKTRETILTVTINFKLT